jgi:mRNA-degrading endonuclease RelE of RelBE toxin-antitoxin system
MLMPSENAPSPIPIEYTSEFKRNLRQLAKRYRHIKSDIQPLLDTLEQGQTPGDQIPGVSYEVFKVRVRNSDSGKGKSGGYRVIYWHRTEGAIVLITIYSKTEQEDIASYEIRHILLEFESQIQATNDDREDISLSGTALDTEADDEAETESDTVQ